MQRKRKQYSIEDQLRALRLGDDNGFTIVLNNNIKGAEFMARTLTGRRNLSIVEAHTQHTVRNPFGHSVVFDIFARDGSGDLICIDIQKVFSGWKDASRRMLQYASMLNLHALEKGSEYGMAKEVFVVFIFDTDIVGDGRALYEYRMRMEDGTELMDANMTIIVANGAYRDTIESDISKLFSDLQESDPGKMKVPVLREAMERLKAEGVFELNKELALNHRGIKVLSLFFIDVMARGYYPSYAGDIFERRGVKWILAQGDTGGMAIAGMLRRRYVVAGRDRGAGLTLFKRRSPSGSEPENATGRVK